MRQIQGALYQFLECLNQTESHEVRGHLVLLFLSVVLTWELGVI